MRLRLAGLLLLTCLPTALAPALADETIALTGWRVADDTDANNGQVTRHVVADEYTAAGGTVQATASCDGGRLNVEFSTYDRGDVGTPLLWDSSDHLALKVQLDGAARQVKIADKYPNAVFLWFGGAGDPASLAQFTAAQRVAVTLPLADGGRIETQIKPQDGLLGEFATGCAAGK